MQQRNNYKSRSRIEVAEFGQRHSALCDIRVSPRTNVADWYATIPEEAKPARDAHVICRNMTPKACSSDRLLERCIVAHLRPYRTNHVSLDRTWAVKNLVHVVSD